MNREHTITTRPDGKFEIDGINFKVRDSNTDPNSYNIWVDSGDMHIDDYLLKTIEFDSDSAEEFELTITEKDINEARQYLDYLQEDE